MTMDNLIINRATYFMERVYLYHFLDIELVFDLIRQECVK